MWSRITHLALVLNFQMVVSESSQSVKSGGCFPGTATVRTPAGPVPMSEIRVGDLVQTGPSGPFSPVLMFLDRHPEGVRQFVQIYTVSGRVLELTPQHLLPVFDPVPEHLTNSHRRLTEIFAADVEVLALKIPLKKIVSNVCLFLDWR